MIFKYLEPYTLQVTNYYDLSLLGSGPRRPIVQTEQSTRDGPFMSTDIRFGAQVRSRSSPKDQMHITEVIVSFQAGAPSEDTYDDDDIFEDDEDDAESFLAAAASNRSELLG